jgi:hypothetical protein
VLKKKKKRKEKKVLWDEKGFCKKKFVLKDCFKMEKRNKDKTSENSECRMRVLSKLKMYDG